MTKAREPGSRWTSRIDNDPCPADPALPDGQPDDGGDRVVRFVAALRGPRPGARDLPEPHELIVLAQHARRIGHIRYANALVEEAFRTYDAIEERSGGRVMVFIPAYDRS